MKRTLFIIFSIIIGSAVFAQTEYDAVQIGQSDILGTARYMSMGGAFGALGGDASALKDNPAGLGVFRSGEMSLTLNGQTQKANSVWYDTKAEDSSPISIKANHVAYIMSIPLWEERTQGLLQSNFSFSYNRLKNFNRTMKATGTTKASFTDFLAGFTDGLSEIDLKYVEDEYEPFENRDVPWLSVLGYEGFLISPSGQNSWMSALDGKAESDNLVYESGGISEYSFGWGGNFNNNLFLGANLNIADLSYRLESVMAETFGVGDFVLNNALNRNGIGVNLKLGAIYLPTNSLRLGAAIHTPTMFTISESNYASVNYNNPSYDVSGKFYTPDEGARQEFNLQTPMQAQLSAAYLFGRKGLISAEYDFINYKGMRFSETNGKRASFSPENEGMKDVLNNGHVIKLGAEFKPTENVALRAGYAMMTPVTNADYTEGKSLRLNTVNTNTEYFIDKGVNYFSICTGYRAVSWFIDLAYGLKLQNEDFYPYQFNRTDLEAAELKTKTHNVALTLGFKI